MFPIQSGATSTIPSVAQAYSFNTTLVPSTPAGFINAYPTGQPLPLAAALARSQGCITGNAAVVPGGTSGFKAVKYSELALRLLEAIGELDAENQPVQERYKSELERNRILESRIAALEPQLTRKDC